MEDTLFQIVLVFALGAACQWISWHFNIPRIVMLLITGLIVGPMCGLLKPDELFGDLLFPIVSLAVAVILFEGGLDLQLKELHGKKTTIFSLVTIGCIVNWLLISLAARYILGFSFHMSMLLGGILTVSGPTVVQPLLRFIRPHEPIYSILKWEGILIDSVGAVLSVLILEEILLSASNSSTYYIGLGLGGTLLMGSLIGYCAGKLFITATKKWPLPEELYNSFSLALLFSAYFISNIIFEEAGLVAVTIMGIVIGNDSHPGVKHIISFKENLRVLLISSLFIILAARVNLELLVSISYQELLFLAFIFFLARPASVFIATPFQGLNIPDRIFLSWMFPRGIVAAAVSSLFAIELEANGIGDAERFVTIVFLVILSTVVIYGVTGPFVARFLGVALQKPGRLLLVGVNSFTRTLAEQLRTLNVDLLIVDTNPQKVERLQQAGFKAICTNILSAEAWNEIEASDLSHSIALTTNPETNTLIALKLEEILGSGLSLQSPAQQSSSIDPRGELDIQATAFPSAHIHITIMKELINSGASLKVVSFEEDPTRDQLQSALKDSVPLFRIRENRAFPYSESHQPKIQAGDQIVTIGPTIPVFGVPEDELIDDDL